MLKEEQAALRGQREERTQRWVLVHCLLDLEKLAIVPVLDFYQFLVEFFSLRKLLSVLLMAQFLLKSHSWAVVASFAAQTRLVGPHLLLKEHFLAL